MASQDFSVDSYWNLTTNQPLYQPFRWGHFSYTLPKVPPDTARDEQKHTVLSINIERLLKEGAPGSFVEKYSILWNHFNIGSSLVKAVELRTHRFRDLSSTAYIYSDVDVLRANMNCLVVANPVTAANREAARYVIMHIRTDPLQIQAHNTIRTLPTPSMAMNILICLPTLDGTLHENLSIYDILQDPRLIINTIRGIPVAEGGGMPHIGFREGESIAVEKYNRWIENVSARVDFAVMDTFLFCDYVGTQVTSSVEACLRKMTTRTPKFRWLTS
jgi:hypothetical protein